MGCDGPLVEKVKVTVGFAPEAVEAFLEHLLVQFLHLDAHVDTEQFAACVVERDGKRLILLDHVHPGATDLHSPQYGIADGVRFEENVFILSMGQSLVGYPVSTTMVLARQPTETEEVGTRLALASSLPIIMGFLIQ